LGLVPGSSDILFLITSNKYWYTILQYKSISMSVAGLDYT